MAPIKQCRGDRRTISEQHPLFLEVDDETMQVIITGRNIMRCEEEEYNFTFRIYSDFIWIHTQYICKDFSAEFKLETPLPDFLFA